MRGPEEATVQRMSLLIWVATLPFLMTFCPARDSLEYNRVVSLCLNSSLMLSRDIAAFMLSSELLSCRRLTEIPGAIHNYFFPNKIIVCLLQERGVKVKI